MAAQNKPWWTNRFSCKACKVFYFTTDVYLSMFRSCDMHGQHYQRPLQVLNQQRWKWSESSKRGYIYIDFGDKQNKGFGTCSLTNSGGFQKCENINISVWRKAPGDDNNATICIWTPRKLGKNSHLKPCTSSWMCWSVTLGFPFLTIM